MLRPPRPRGPRPWRPRAIRCFDASAEGGGGLKLKGDSRATNAGVVLAYYSALNKGDVDAAVAFWAKPLRDEQRRRLETMRLAFPDYAVHVADAVGQRDRVVVRQVEKGTHLGDPHSELAGGLLNGVVPSGKRMEIQVIHVYRVTGGWIAEHWESRNDLEMLRQLGLIETRG